MALARNFCSKLLWVPSLQLNKLSAPGILRMSKVASYVEGKLREKQDAGAGDTEVEILCKQELLPLRMNLRSVQRFVWKQPEDVVLHYRYKVADLA